MHDRPSTLLVYLTRFQYVSSGSSGSRLPFVFCHMVWDSRFDDTFFMGDGTHPDRPRGGVRFLSLPPVTCLSLTVRVLQPSQVRCVPVSCHNTSAVGSHFRLWLVIYLHFDSL